MKRNKVLSVAIPIMLLAGCGGVKHRLIISQKLKQNKKIRK
ncbi:hypothetical protein [Bacillus pseudomycoides]|nr:hypothetical protein [Bacillus pseudomycoides]